MYFNLVAALATVIVFDYSIDDVHNGRGKDAPDWNSQSLGASKWFIALAIEKRRCSSVFSE
jgi:hypothetical protein